MRRHDLLPGATVTGSSFSPSLFFRAAGYPLVIEQGEGPGGPESGSDRRKCRYFSFVPIDPLAEVETFRIIGTATRSKQASLLLPTTLEDMVPAACADDFASRRARFAVSSSTDVERRLAVLPAEEQSPPFETRIPTYVLRLTAAPTAAPFICVMLFLSGPRPPPRSL